MDAVDRISNLPPNVTDDILLRLPFNDAVRTCILSTDWRYKWTHLPNLIIILDQWIEKYDNGISCSEYSREALDAGMREFSDTVNNILLCHDGPIHKFVLYIPSWFKKRRDIRRWIQFVSRNFVKEFTLWKDLWCGLGNLPSTMFSCMEFNHLTHLTLRNWSIPSISNTFSGFPCLISLKIEFMGTRTKEAKKIGILVSKCPLLEKLYLMIDEKESCLTIHAPKLQMLVVHGSLSGIVLEETDRLKIASLNVERCKANLLMEILNCLPVVEELVLESKFLTVASLSEPDPSKSNVEGDCHLDHLKTAEVSTIFYKVALPLIHMLLSSSPVLEKMTFKSNFEAEEEISLAEELSEYRHASANPEIIFETMMPGEWHYHLPKHWEEEYYD